MVGVVPCPARRRPGQGELVSPVAAGAAPSAGRRPTAGRCVRRQLFSLGVAASLGSGLTDR